jgi:RNA polymerase sigma-70 factor (ECF subfamily)
MEQTQWLDEREIGRLVGAYADMLLRIALNRTQNLAEAEDIVQSVFERLVTVKPRFENREHEKAWLIRTAVNLCKDYQKSAARRRNMPLDEEAVSAFPAETIEVLDAVRRLPENDRYAVYLFYYERVPVREIAAILGEREGTVSSRLSRARKKLKTLLKGDGYATVSNRV